MLEQPMIEKLLSMRLQGMADALKAQEQDPGVGSQRAEGGKTSGVKYLIKG